MSERSVSVQHYLGRANDFFQGMKLLRDDLATFKSSSALLGIHGAIAYSDALRIGLGGQSLFADDHSAAEMELRKLCAARRYEKLNGIGRLRDLLNKKSRVAYSDAPLSENQVKLIVVDAERFEVWANTAARELKVEGWEDESG
jgi:hypothetical protein